MIKAFLNILKAPFIYVKRLGQPRTEDQEFEYTGFIPGKDVPKVWSCAMLDTADRAASLLGTPAKKLYASIAAWSEYLWSSIRDEYEPIYRENYVNKTIAGWLSEEDHMKQVWGTNRPDIQPLNMGPVPFQTETIEIPKMEEA